MDNHTNYYDKINRFFKLKKKKKKINWNNLHSSHQAKGYARIWNLFFFQFCIVVFFFFLCCSLGYYCFLLLILLFFLSRIRTTMQPTTVDSSLGSQANDNSSCETVDLLSYLADWSTHLYLPIHVHVFAFLIYPFGPCKNELCLLECCIFRKQLETSCHVQPYQMLVLIQLLNVFVVFDSLIKNKIIKNQLINQLI